MEAQATVCRIRYPHIESESDRLTARNLPKQRSSWPIWGKGRSANQTDLVRIPGAVRHPGAGRTARVRASFSQRRGLTLACEVMGTTRCSLWYPIRRPRTAQPVRGFATSGESPSGRCSTASSARIWPHSLLKPPIAIPAASCPPSSPRNFRATCAAASSAMASPASAVPLAATSCSSPSRARIAAYALPAAPDAWPVPLLIFETMFYPRSRCANGFSRSRGDFDLLGRSQPLHRHNPLRRWLHLRSSRSGRRPPHRHCPTTAIQPAHGIASTGRPCSNAPSPWTCSVAIVVLAGGSSAP